jgi:hypothetical protein
MQPRSAVQIVSRNSIHIGLYCNLADANANKVSAVDYIVQLLKDIGVIGVDTEKIRSSLIIKPCYRENGVVYYNLDYVDIYNLFLNKSLQPSVPNIYKNRF